MVETDGDLNRFNESGSGSLAKDNHACSILEPIKLESILGKTYGFTFYSEGRRAVMQASVAVAGLGDFFRSHVNFL